MNTFLDAFTDELTKVAASTPAKIDFNSAVPPRRQVGAVATKPMNLGIPSSGMAKKPSPMARGAMDAPKGFIPPGVPKPTSREGGQKIMAARARGSAVPPKRSNEQQSKRDVGTMLAGMSSAKDFAAKSKRPTKRLVAKKPRRRAAPKPAAPKKRLVAKKAPSSGPPKRENFNTDVMHRRAQHTYAKRQEKNKVHDLGSLAITAKRPTKRLVAKKAPAPKKPTGIAGYYARGMAKAKRAKAKGQASARLAKVKSQGQRAMGVDKRSYLDKLLNRA